MSKKICIVTTSASTLKSFFIPMARFFATNADWEICLMSDDDAEIRQMLPDGVRFRRRRSPLSAGHRGYRPL